MKSEVCVLLSTYNGEKFLEYQLESLFSQTYKKFDLIVRDDGSIDKTISILEKYKIKYFNCKNIGVVKSFLNLLRYSKSKNYEFYFFCDQDDIWDKNKVERQLAFIESLDLNKPILIHSDMKVIDENNKLINDSFFEFNKLDKNKKSFNYLLVQNNITGNSILFNKKLADLIEYHNNIIMHDWWIGLIASVFGKIYFIDEPLVFYRKHSCNVIGLDKYYSFSKIIKFFNYSLNKQILQAIAFKDIYYNYMDKKSQILLDKFIELQNNNFFIRKFNMFKYKFFMQSLGRNIGLLWKI